MEWIKCSDRLPEFGSEEVLVCYKIKELMVRAVSSEYFYMPTEKMWYKNSEHYGSTYSEDEITHWLPIPKLPKENKDADKITSPA